MPCRLVPLLQTALGLGVAKVYKHLTPYGVKHVGTGNPGLLKRVLIFAARAALQFVRMSFVRFYIIRLILFRLTLRPVAPGSDSDAKLHN